MIDKLKEVFDLETLFQEPLLSLNFMQLLALALISILLFFVVKYLLKFIKIALKFIAYLLGSISSKSRCKKHQCPHCGRTLDKCVCECNRGRSYTYRLNRYNKELRVKKKELKRREKAQKLQRRSN